MLPEFAAYFWCLILLGIIGLAPAVVMIRASSGRLAHALALAPAFGWAVMSLIGFPLARWLAPVGVWAWPATLVLAGLGIAVGLRDWRRFRPQYAVLANRRTLGLISFIVLLNLIMAAPLLLRGIQYAIYRSNPDDAFLYMSLAESLRVASWSTLTGGSGLTLNSLPSSELIVSNLSGITALAHLSPTALFTARLVDWPLALNKMAVLAWSAEVAGTTVPRFYYAHHLLAFGVSLPLVLALGSLLRLPMQLVCLVATAIVMGFWARLVLETDAGYEISVIPVMLLLLFTWIRLESEDGGKLSASRWTLALTWAVTVALYAPLALLIAIAFTIYYGFQVVRQLLSVRAPLRHGFTALLSVAMLTGTGQIDYLARNAVLLIERSPGEAQFRSRAMDLIRADGIAAIWGLPGSALWGSRAPAIRLPLDQIANAAGLVLTVALVLGALEATRKASYPGTRVVISLLMSGFLMSGLSMALGNLHAAGKGFTYVYPLLILGLALSISGLGTLFTANGQRIMLAVIYLWLATQAAMGLFLPLRGRSDFLGQPAKVEQYDLSPITSQLDRAHPSLLLVDIPRAASWPFAYYCMFVFGRYPAHFQSGLIVDNRTATPNLWLDPLNQIPDYAVVLKAADTIGTSGLGSKVAETADLVLYRIVSGDLTLFQQNEPEVSH